MIKICFLQVFTQQNKTLLHEWWPITWAGETALDHHANYALLTRRTLCVEYFCARSPTMCVTCELIRLFEGILRGLVLHHRQQKHEIYTGDESSSTETSGSCNRIYSNRSFYIKCTFCPHKMLPLTLNQGLWLCCIPVSTHQN